MPTLTYRVLVVGLGLLALVGQAVQLRGILPDPAGLPGGPVARAHPAYASVVAMDAVLTLAMVGFALLLAFHRRATPAARPLGLAVAVWSYLLGYVGLIALLQPAGGGAAGRLLFQSHFLVVEMVGLAALMRFSALFPRPLEPGDLRSPETLGPGLGALQRLRHLLLRPAAPWLAAGGGVGAALVVGGVLGEPPSRAVLLGLVDGLRFAALSAVVLNLRRAYLLSTPRERESARWLGVGFALLVASLALLMGGNVLTAVTGWRVAYVNWRPIILDLGLLGFVWGTSMGAVYRGGLRSGAVGRGVVTGSALALVTLLLGAGLEALLSDALLAGLDLPRGIGTGLALLATVGLWLRFPAPLTRVLEAPSGEGTRGASGKGWISVR